MDHPFEPRLVASICALDGHGKTTFLLTAPKPLDVFHIDPNTEEIVEKERYAGSNDVRLHAVEYPASIFGSRDRLQDDAEKAWTEQFIDPLREVLEDRDARSIGLDTGTELFELLLMADHGKTVQILPEMRTKTNYKFKGLLQALKRSRKHVILLHRLKDVWRDEEVRTAQGVETRRNKIPGEYEREGFSKVGYHVNVEAFLRFEPERSENLSKKYGIRIVRSTQRPGLVDGKWQWGREEIEGERVRRCSVPWLGMQTYPHTSLKDWQ